MRHFEGQEALYFGGTMIGLGLLLVLRQQSFLAEVDRELKFIGAGVLMTAGGALAVHGLGKDSDRSFIWKLVEFFSGVKP